MTSERKILVVIAGPTGSGKTDVSVELARRLGSPIISTDSRQVFRGMAIGTAQPSKEQLEAVQHYFIADREITEEYNAGRFAQEASELLRKLFVQYEYVVAAGGSGLYIDALCRGLDEMPAVDPQLRTEVSEEYRLNGLKPLLRELETADPAYYNNVDKHNPARVLRAVEVCRQTGRPYSSLRVGEGCKPFFEVVKIGIDTPREELYERIDRRVEAMMAAGLEDEARRLYPLRRLNSLQTVGYRELFEYFDGSLSLGEAVELIKRNSRRYAKRQMTWFRRDTSIRWFGRNEVDSMENFCKKFAE